MFKNKKPDLKKSGKKRKSKNLRKFVTDEVSRSQKKSYAEFGKKQIGATVFSVEMSVNDGIDVVAY